MAVSHISFAGLAAIVLVGLFALVALVMLLGSERGRTILKVLLIVPALVLVVGFLAVLSLRLSRHHSMLRGTEAVRHAIIAEEAARAAHMAEARAGVGSGAAQAETPKSDTSYPAKLPGADSQAPKAASAAETVFANTPPQAEPAPAADPPENTASKPEPPPPEKRPDWVDAPPHKVGGSYFMTVSVGPFSTRFDCDRELPQQLQAAVDEYVSTYLGPRAGRSVRLPVDYIQNQIVKAEWEQPKQVRITPAGQTPEEYVVMPRLHVLLEFNHAANARIEEEWEKAIVAERLAGVAGLGALLLGLLAATWGYLRIDLATGGQYRGRLRLAAAALVVAMLAAGAVLAKL